MITLQTSPLGLIGWLSGHAEIYIDHMMEFQPKCLLIALDNLHEQMVLRNIIQDVNLSVS